MDQPHPRIVVDPTPEMLKHLEALRRTGLFGKTTGDVAHGLICSRLQELLKDRVFLTLPAERH